MKPFRMLGRSIRDAIKSVVRNFSLSLASISCITITLIIVAVAIMASYNVQNFTKEIERDMTIVAFLDNDASESDREDIEKEFKSISNVDKYTYQSKQEVKEKMQAESDVFDTVLQNWSDEESPLKDTYQIKVKDVEKLSKTAVQIQRIDKIAVVRYGSGMVDKMISAFNQVEKITYGNSRNACPSMLTKGFPLTREELLSANATSWEKSLESTCMSKWKAPILQAVSKTVE